jgi:hypothetical protein
MEVIVLPAAVGEGQLGQRAGHDQGRRPGDQAFPRELFRYH